MREVRTKVKAAGETACPTSHALGGASLLLIVFPIATSGADVRLYLEQLYGGQFLLHDLILLEVVGRQCLQTQLTFSLLPQPGQDRHGHSSSL